MPWANPFQRMAEDVLRLTKPPEHVDLPAGAEAVAVGLLMRVRVLLRANALLADRLLGGAADPLTRALLEACFTAGWVLADPTAYNIYLGHYRRKWRIIAQEQEGKVAPIDPRIRSELQYFLDRSRPELPPEADTPPFDQQAKAGGFDDFYSIYRMATRRAHHDLDAARTGLIKEAELDTFRINASPLAPELAEAYVKTGIYLVAKLGEQIDFRLGWGRATELRALVEGLDKEAEEAITAARAKLAETEPAPQM